MKLFSESLHQVLLLAALVIPGAALAGSWNTDQDGVVLDGYDVVSYQTEDKAVKGSPNNVAKYDGVKFYFSSNKNKSEFVKNPKKYIPKYNGYCAFAMGAKNAKVPANADTFKMYNGQLLVFFNDMYDGSKFNTKVPWNGAEKSLFSKAESNWKAMK